MGVPPPDLSHVLLSWPKHLNDPGQVQKGSGPNRYWIQLARIGAFVSNRYGKFAITKQDLAQMVKNFREVTPQAPTELPIDYDHISMDPKKPGDGIAAGWMKQLELRGDGEELWAEVEWTPAGARRVADGEYRFVSPSFVKDHTHKDGTKIGTTLLAAAITNHPFLEGMKALNGDPIATLTLSSVGELALMLGERSKEPVVETVVNLAEIGQRVMIAPGFAKTMDEVGGSFEIVEVVGQGDDAFVAMKDANGVRHQWFRATELLPASATPMPVAPNLQPGVPNPDAKPAVAPLGADGKPVAPVAPMGADGKPKTPDQAHKDAADAAVAAGKTPEDAAAAGEAAKEAALAPGPAAADGTASALTPEEEAQVKQAGDAAVAQAVLEGKTPEEQAAAKLAAEDEARQTIDAGKKKVAPSAKTSQDVGAGVVKKTFGAVSSANSPKGTAHMMFKLRNDKDEEFEVSAEQLEAAGISVVPEGSSVIVTTELNEMKGSVTSLSSRVETLAAAAAASESRAASVELNNELDRLSNGAFITRTQREYAVSQWGKTTDLSAFKAWAATFTTPLLSLNSEHGSGGRDGEAAAADQLIALANTIAKDKGISLRDATIQASKELPDVSESYRERFGTH